ncbi:hypothetical protein [Rhizobium leguminosarum]|uniref:HD family hydrolase n=1 Tax=Rhizobium leguminosarum TaxID=384 RepID=A0A2K9ZG13_RHILE|nr:hypothetical protein [Rhizobium leguminosarum]AUW47196.1 hypothetical protein CUJ84_pRLN3000058 [Rhizobium leguminosarum]
MNAQVAVKMKSGPSIMLASGSWFDLLDPWASEFTIADIAQGLSNICRYAGQCRDFYSVAEHSLHVSETAEQFKLEALLHDAAEAFIGDITRPLKQLLPEYKTIEANVEAAIFHRFGMDEKAKPYIKSADLRVLAAEQAQLMPAGTDFWAAQSNIHPAPVKVEFLAPAVARHRFLTRFQQLLNDS